MIKSDREEAKKASDLLKEKNGYLAEAKISSVYETNIEMKHTPGITRGYFLSFCGKAAVFYDGNTSPSGRILFYSGIKGKKMV